MKTIYEYSMSFKTSLKVWGIILLLFFVTTLATYEVATSDRKNNLFDCNIIEVNYDDDNELISLDVICPFGKILNERVVNEYKFLRNHPETIKCYQVEYKTGTSRGCKI